MPFTRRGFFARIGAIAVGAVLAGKAAPKPAAFKSRMWFTHRSFHGAVLISDEAMLRDRLMFVNDRMAERMAEWTRLEIARMNTSLLDGSASGTPKGFLR